VFAAVTCAIVAACSAGQLAPRATTAFSPASALTAPSITTRLYVADQSADKIVVYPAGVASPAPIQTLTDGVRKPVSIATDAAGNLYVFNGGYKTGPFLSKFAPGASKPSSTMTLPSSLSALGWMAFGPDGTIYIVGFDSQGSQILEYYAGATSPSLTIQAPSSSNPFRNTAAVDRKNNFYTVLEGGANADGPIVFPPKSTSYSFVKYTAGALGAITFDNTGDLLVAHFSRNHGERVLVVEPTGSRSFATTVYPSSMAFDGADDVLYLADNNMVSIMDYATKTQIGELTGFPYIVGVAVGPNPY
jgi:hypothetical protein